jgi:hypothetical protein
MKIYTIDNDGFIVGIKDVGNKYIMNPNDFEGEAPFPNNHHHLTGLERPKTQEQINAERITELKELITNKQLLGDSCSTEQDELRTLLGL